VHALPADTGRRGSGVASHARRAPPAGLVGEPAATPWDPELAAVMRRRNLRIEEELTLDALLQDLGP
jgi:Protein of unknown function C-terminus (DUF2399)